MNSSRAPGYGRLLRACSPLLLGASLLAAPDAHAQQVTRPEAQQPAQGSARVIARVNDLLKRKRPLDAIATAEDGLASFADNVQLRFLLGVAQTDAGRRDAAVSTFEKLVADHPELAEPYNNLAVLYASDGRLEAARGALEQAVRAVPDYGLAYENLGDVHLRMAQEAYERAGNVAKPSPTARRKLNAVRDLSSGLLGQ